jgi:RNA polymerase sigma factor (sigma-70 family)
LIEIISSYFRTLAFLKNISSSSLTDLELIAQYKLEGDPGLVGTLYERYMDLVYGVCLKYLKQPENAQDSVINIFEELLEKLKKHEIENFRAWLHTVAKNHCLMRLRSEKKQVTVNYDVELMQSEENLHLNGELDKEENFQVMEYCLGQLQEDQRSVIELFYLQGKSYQEIAGLTGLEWNKVRSFIQNGRRNLKICMEGQKLKSELENGSVIKK